jgi:putative oxidoreductase
MELLTTLNFWLWVAAALLAFAYVMSGIMKATRPIPALAQMMKWPGDYPPGFTRFIGVVDLLGGIGIVLPLATGILAWLSPVAAICLVILQMLAIGFHWVRGEMQVLPANVILLALAAFVAWGRLPLLGL